MKIGEKFLTKKMLIVLGGNKKNSKVKAFLMRFGIDFDKGENRTPTMLALDAFLNEHTIEFYHGKTFECIFITFIEKPTKSRKYKKKLLYGKYADISLPAYEFSKNLSLKDFMFGFESAIESVQKTKEIDIKNMDFDSDKLLFHLESAKKHLPKTENDLEQYF